jgi:hypothetical protein
MSSNKHDSYRLRCGIWAPDRTANFGMSSNKHDSYRLRCGIWAPDRTANFPEALFAVLHPVCELYCGHQTTVDTLLLIDYCWYSTAEINHRALGFLAEFFIHYTKSEEIFWGPQNCISSHVTVPVCCQPFLGAFAKLRRATISFVVSVRKEQLGSHWTDFHEIWYLSIFRKYV